MTIKPAGRGPQVLAVYGLFLALTTITASLRVYCRVRIQKTFGLDDWFVISAWVFFVLYAACAITGVYHGTGQHAWDIQPPTEILVGMKLWWLCEPFYVLSSMSIKASIGIMLLRLSIERSHHNILWITLAIVELYGAFYFFLFLFQCIPSAYFWTQYASGSGSCIDSSITIAVTYGYSAITCAGDLVYSILPCFLVWSLQMNQRDKLLVMCILAMAAIASAATIARIPYVHSLGNAADFLYATTDVAILSGSESGLSITAACCQPLRSLLHFHGWLLPSDRHNSVQMYKPRRHNYGANSAIKHAKEDRRGYERSSSTEDSEQVTL